MMAYNGVMCRRNPCPVFSYCAFTPTCSRCRKPSGLVTLCTTKWVKSRNLAMLMLTCLVRDDKAATQTPGHHSSTALTVQYPSTKKRISHEIYNFDARATGVNAVAQPQRRPHSVAQATDRSLCTAALPLIARFRAT